MAKNKTTALEGQKSNHLKGNNALAANVKGKRKRNNKRSLKKELLSLINAEKESEQEKPKPERFKKLADSFVTSRNIIGNLFIIGLSILLIYTVYTEIKRDDVQINSFTVPSDFEKNGLSSQVIASKLADKINSISQIDPKLPSDETTFPDVTVPSTNISLKTFINYLRPKPTGIGGEIISNGKGFNITIRIYNNKNPKKENDFFTGSADDLDALLNQAAEYFMRTAYPYSFASYLYENGKPAEALDSALYCIYTVPETDDASCYLLWGLILYDEGKMDEALEKYEIAGQKDSTLLDHIYINQGIIHEAKGENHLAIEKYERAKEKNPENSIAYNNLGYWLLMDKKYNEAIENFKKAIEIEPNNILPYKNLGAVFINKEQYKEADEVYMRAIAMNPKKIEDIYLAWGWELKEKDPENAITKYEKLIKLNPCNSNAYNNWGYILASSYNFTDAILKYREAVRCDNRNRYAYANWRDAIMEMQGEDKLRELKLYEPAIFRFQKALEESSPDSYNYWALARGLETIGKYEEAEVYYKKSIKFDAKIVENRLNFANMLKSRGRNEDAREQCQELINREPDGDFAKQCQEIIKEIDNNQQKPGRKK